MKMLFIRKTLIVFTLFFGLSLMFYGSTFAVTTPSLGVASNYAILASTYTNIVGGIINGDVSYTTAPAVLPIINGTIVVPKDPQAGIDQNTALADLNSQLCDFSFTVATDLSLLPQPLTPGVYCIAAAASIGAGGLTLDGVGTYIFRIDGAFDTLANSVVSLVGGADACNIFWAPNVTTLGANSMFIGTVIDNAGITVGDNVTWIGRALNFATTITTNNDTITVPVCSIPSFGTGVLNVVKNVVNVGGGTAVASDFIISVYTSTGIFVGSGVGTGIPGTTYLLSSGMYTVTENINTSYNTTFSLLLGDCLNFSISSGDNKTCTVLNTYIIPTPSGGGGGGGLLIDDCPDGDYSTSYYDGICGLSPDSYGKLINIVKIANRVTPFHYGGGDVIYTYIVTNPNSTPISNVVVTDDKCSPLVFVGGDSNNDNLLNISEVRTYTCSANISVSTRNVAKVVGRLDGVIVTDTDFANVVVELSSSEKPVLPKLPKTGLTGISSWNIAIIIGVLLMFLIPLFVEFKKRDS